MTSPCVTPRGVRSREDCLYYHTIELPGLGLIRGFWDLRGGEDAYLGNVEVAGRSVLEIGPASGFLTAHLESRGAAVTAAELGPTDSWDVVPQRTHDLTEVLAARVGVMDQLRNSFWLTHRLLGLQARLHEGSAYALPAELGRYDIALMGAVLLHTRAPLAILEHVAARVDDTLGPRGQAPERRRTGARRSRCGRRAARGRWRCCRASRPAPPRRWSRPWG